MALQQFVSQVETQTKGTPANGGALPVQNHAKPASADPRDSNRSIVNLPAGNNSEATSRLANDAQRAIPVDARNVLSQADQRTLMALAAVQTRYGRPAEAVPYLTMIRKLNPENAEASRLLALALIKLERWDQAETILDELDALNATQTDSTSNGIMMLYRSLVSFRKNRFEEARSWFSRFRVFCSGGMRT